MGYSPDYYKNQFEAAIKLAAKHAEECMRLRTALEKYADEYNWISVSTIFDDAPWVRYMKGNHKRPFEIAQEALKDAP